jgi:hypothetical protein
VRTTLIKNLRTATVRLPHGPDGSAKELTTKELGVSFPVLVECTEPKDIPNPLLETERVGPTGVGGEEAEEGAFGGVHGFGGGGSFGQPAATPPAAGSAAEGPERVVDPDVAPFVKKCDFTVQFCWQGITASQRREIEKKRRQAEMEQAEATGGGEGGF